MLTVKWLVGACISMERRCDQFPDCADFSDEESASQKNLHPICVHWLSLRQTVNWWSREKTTFQTTPPSLWTHRGNWWKRVFKSGCVVSQNKLLAYILDKQTEHCFADPADQNSQNWWSWTDIQESIHHVYDLVGICIITFSKYPSPGIALFVRLFVVTKLWLHARACVCVF